MDTKDKFSFRNLFTKWYFLLIIIFLLIVVFFVCISEFHVQNYFLKGRFDIGSKTFIKLNVPEGEESSDTVLITNNGRKDEFAVSFLGLDNIASVSENNFYIESGGSKKITLIFKDFSSASGINLGWLIIKSSSSEKKIPVIVVIEDKEAVFAIIQTPIPNYLNVFPNGKIGIDIKFSNLKDFDVHNVKVTYLMKNFDNNIYFSETEEFSIKEDLSAAKIFNLPKSVGKGNYVFIITAESSGSKSFSSYIFEVKGKGFNINLDILQNYLVLIILIVAAAVLIYFVYFIKSGSGLYQLNRQQRKEMKRNFDLIKEYKEEMKKDLSIDMIDEEKRILEECVKLKREKEAREQEKLLEKKEKLTKKGQKEVASQFKKKKTKLLELFEEKLNEIDKKKEEIVREIKEKHEKQREEIKQFEKQNKKNEIEKRLILWEKEAEKMPFAKKQLDIKEDKIKQILKKEERGAEHEFMKKFYSDLRRKKFKLE